jgi:hypothetical protein
MATAGNVADLILKRVYAYGGISHTQAEVIDFLSKTQRITNAFLGKITSSSALTVLGSKLVYKLRDDLASAIDVLWITESRAANDEELLHVASLDELTAYDQDWFRCVTATRFDAWVQLGRDLLILYPGKAAGGTVTVGYTKLLTALTAAGDTLELADEDLHVVADLAEIICLARDKQITVCREKLQQLATYLALEEIK